MNLFGWQNRPFHWPAECNEIKACKVKTLSCRKCTFT
uniref:Uncharacterized protein n=1 Tax=Anguilla anguilla TaxID=7936 RepID=A0A0E9T6G8_ANGAN